MACCWKRCKRRSRQSRALFDCLQDDKQDEALKLIASMNLRTLNLRKKVASDWLTPLMYAMKQGLPKIVIALLKKGVEWDERHSLEMKALFECIENNQQDDALHLIESMDETTLNFLAYDVGGVNVTALMHALQHSQMSVVRALIEKGANTDIRHSLEMKAVFECIENNQQNEALNLIASMDASTLNLILDYGTVLQRRKNVTALFKSVQKSQIKVVKALLAKGVDVNIGEVVFEVTRDIHSIRETPLYYAIQGGHIALMDMLLENGADLQLNPEEKRFSGLSGKTYEYHEPNDLYGFPRPYNIMAFNTALRKGGYTLSRVLQYSNMSTEFGWIREKHTCLCYAVEYYLADFFSLNRYQCMQQTIQRGGVVCSGNSQNTASKVNIAGAKEICSNIFHFFNLMVNGGFCTYSETAQSLLSMILATDYIHENSCLYKTLKTYTDTIKPRTTPFEFDMFDYRTRKRVVHTLEGRKQVLARLSNITRQPSKLKHICRVYIRRSIHGLCTEVVETLPLPTKLIDYVNVVDKCEIEESCLK